MSSKYYLRMKTILILFSFVLAQNSGYTDNIILALQKLNIFMRKLEKF